MQLKAQVILSVTNTVSDESTYFGWLIDQVSQVLVVHFHDIKQVFGAQSKAWAFLLPLLR